MNINVEVKTIYPKDNFYLQWSYIYWWQFEFNLKLMMQNVLCELVKVEIV